VDVGDGAARVENGSTADSHIPRLRAHDPVPRIIMSCYGIMDAVWEIAFACVLLFFAVWFFGPVLVRMTRSLGAATRREVEMRKRGGKRRRRSRH